MTYKSVNHFIEKLDNIPTMKNGYGECTTKRPYIRKQPTKPPTDLLHSGEITHPESGSKLKCIQEVSKMDFTLNSEEYKWINIFKIIVTGLKKKSEIFTWDRRNILLFLFSYIILCQLRWRPLYWTVCTKFIYIYIKCYSKKIINTYMARPNFK